MQTKNSEKIQQLLTKGVQIPNPESIEIGEEINIDRISGEGVMIHSGCKIYGESTLILQGATLGYEAPTTIDNCYIGPKVELKGGFFKKAVFLEKASMGSGAHVREGTILEEEASGAHTVGLKQTILFPFVTLGSLINFCDCFMSGGTDRKNHSEVGSSYIHFNFTPNQDKATASLIGDVPRGVMLNQRQIFLGGQGGLVGPCRFEYGTVIAAGTIYRKDELRPGRLLLEGNKRSLNIPYTPGKLPGFSRIIKNNVIYIANLIALSHWYVNVRHLFISTDFPEELFVGLCETLDMAVSERIKRLNGLCQNLEGSDNASGEVRALSEKWEELEDFFTRFRDIKNDRIFELNSMRDSFLKKINIGIDRSGKKYIPVVKGLAQEDSETGSNWLQSTVDLVITEAYKIL